LMALAETGGYGFVFVAGTDKDGKPLDAASTQGAPVSIAFRGENYSRAINSVLLSAGLQARLEGNLIVVGPNVLGQSFGTQLSKVYRLNQASAISAADYLASLGASITKVSVITNATQTGTPQGNQVAGGTTTTQTETQRITTTETYGATTGPLKGLTGTTDSRLQTITLIGDPLVIAVAENYLRQLDLRQRQVALTVRILDVNLSNDTTISNSFAFRYGNNFIINNGGELAAVWGNVNRGNTLLGSGAPSVNSFWNELRATIESGSTKLLASPTLILTDNPEAITGGAATTVAAGAALGTASIGRERQNEAFVTVGSQVVTNYTLSSAATGTGSNVITCVATFGTSGLTFGARVSKIDDNGFVTFSLSPSVSAETDTVNFIGCGPASILSVRRLDTGSVRVRDGQTLILTGVISDLNAQTVAKWPILGDLPLVGQFFRNSSSTRQKRELVIMVTPRIINDTDGGSYGYGYQPASAESRQLMGASQGGI